MIPKDIWPKEGHHKEKSAMIKGEYIKKWGSFAPSGMRKWAIQQSNLAPQSLWGSLHRRAALGGLKRPIDVVRFGAQFRLYPLDNLCEKRALLKAAQFDAIERAALTARFHPHFRFVDIGANIGLYSLFVAMGAGAKASILAVEPQPIIQERLGFNIAANAGANITHINCALAETKGTAHMQISDQNRGGTGFLRRDGGVPDGEVLVQTRVLVDVLQEQDMHGADALKIDIEGAEDQVLPGYFQTISDADLPRLLILERNENWKIDCVALAIGRGYQVVDTAHMNVVLERARV